MRYVLPMRYVLLLLLIGVACCVAGAVMPSTGPGGSEVKPAGLRVGTFDQRAVALAYRRSKTFERWLDGKREEFKRANEAGDERRAKGITDQIVREQEAAHREVFGTGPYDALAEPLQPVLAKAAKARDVALITATVYFHGPDVQLVDVTPSILDALGTDAATRKMIDELQEQIRSGKYNPHDFKGGD